MSAVPQLLARVAATDSARRVARSLARACRQARYRP